MLCVGYACDTIHSLVKSKPCYCWHIGSSSLSRLETQLWETRLGMKNICSSHPNWI